MVRLGTAAVYVVALIRHGDKEQTHTIGHQSLIYLKKKTFFQASREVKPFISVSTVIYFSSGNLLLNAYALEQLTQ
jgi:hypothetical protein